VNLDISPAEAGTPYRALEVERAFPQSTSPRADTFCASSRSLLRFLGDQVGVFFHPPASTLTRRRLPSSA
jgi:hypothetical protein